MCSIVVALFEKLSSVRSISLRCCISSLKCMYVIQILPAQKCSQSAMSAFTIAEIDRKTFKRERFGNITHLLHILMLIRSNERSFSILDIQCLSNFQYNLFSLTLLSHHSISFQFIHRHLMWFRSIAKYMHAFYCTISASHGVYVHHSICI